MTRADAGWMARALALAAEGRGTTSPNPMVGAVVVAGERAVGEGFHARAGEPHAEIHALRAAGDAARGATLYVSLEPCCHTGRTGPCTEAILAAGVARVVVGAIDPNPRVAGQGVAWLRARGVEVETGVLAAEAERLNEAFALWITRGRAHLALKLATSLDGRIAAGSGASRWITGEASRAAVHGLRAAADAVMVGARTALADDPRLDVRDAAVRGGQPARVLVDARLEVPVTARLFAGGGEPPAVVATARPEDDAAAEARRAAGAEVWSLPGDGGRVDLAALLARLGQRPARPLTSVLCEGGGRLAAGLLAAGLVDRLHLFVAPLVLGADGLPAFGPLGLAAPGDAPRFHLEVVERLGDDVHLVGRPARAATP